MVFLGVGGDWKWLHQTFYLSSAQLKTISKAVRAAAYLAESSILEWQWQKIGKQDLRNLPCPVYRAQSAP